MIKIREVEEEDLLPLAEFLPRGFPVTTKDFWLARFEMWWVKNPAWAEKIPRGWVLDDGTKLVGFIGNVPVAYQIRGTDRIAAASSSWFVDPDIRGIYSIRLFNEFLKQRNISLFLFKAEEEYIKDFLTKYQFEEYILPASGKEFAYILDKKKFDFIFVKFIFNKQVPKLSDVPELYKRLGYLMLGYLFQKPVARPKGNDTYTSSICTSCDESFSKLGKSGLKQCDLVISPDTKTMNWLYFSPARFFKRVVIQCHNSHEKTLAGYMVFDIERNTMAEGGKMRLMEMCIDDKDPRVISSLLSFAIETGKQMNAALLVVWPDSMETDAFFRSILCMRRTAQHYRYFRFSDTNEMHKGTTDHGTVCPSLIYPPQ